MKRTPLARKTPLKPVSAKRKAHKASAEGRAGKAHMAAVAQLPCVICGARPVQVHHVIHGRYGTRKAPDTDTIPLCRSCHDSLHAGKEAWAAKWGPDYTYLPRVRAMVGK